MWRTFVCCAHRTKLSDVGATPENEDVDVAREREAVLRGDGGHQVLRLENLTKVCSTADPRRYRGS